jgi:hypothetical protein
MEVSRLDYKNENEKVCDSVRSLSHNLMFYPGNELSTRFSKMQTSDTKNWHHLHAFLRRSTACSSHDPQNHLAICRCPPVSSVLALNVASSF